MNKELNQTLQKVQDLLEKVKGLEALTEDYHERMTDLVAKNLKLEVEIKRLKAKAGEE